MKLQYLAVIFVIIILPISLVLSFYVNSRIDTLNMQTDYTSKLNNATYDAVKAFQINTTNSYYSSVSDSKIRDIEASVNTFYNSLTASLGYTKSELQAYVPAIVYTLYDGYYIYGKRYNVLNDDRVDRKDGTDQETKDEVIKFDIATDTETETNADFYEYGLKPFVYYSCRYKSGNNDFVVNFTLDNFISIYGTVKGRYVTKSGYLIDLRKCGDVELRNGKAIKVGKYKGANIEATEDLSEYLMFTDGTSGFANKEYKYIIYNNQKVYIDGDTYFWFENGNAHTIDGDATKAEIRELVSQKTKSAREYYTDAYNFSVWVTNNIGGIFQKDIENGEKLEYTAGERESFFDMNKQDPEDTASTFNQHRIAVIKNAIETNLIAAINSYNSNADSYAYALPKLSEEEWEKVVNNVCVISFMQGLPLGGKYFNDYSVVPNDNNNEFVDIDSIYLLTNDGHYHMPNCTLLVESKDWQNKIIGGYLNTSFEMQTVDEKYYYKHVIDSTAQNPTTYTGCYQCIVNSNEKYELEDILNGKISNIDKLRSKYLTILAREKYNLYKTNN